MSKYGTEAGSAGWSFPAHAVQSVRGALGPALLLLGLVHTAGVASAQSAPCPDPNDRCDESVADVPPGVFPRITFWDGTGAQPPGAWFRAFPGVIGSQGQDSTVSRKATIVWERDLALEQQLVADTARGGFGGYNIYRVFTNRDTCRLELIRRFVIDDTLLWHFPDSQRVVSFVDPDSAGNLVKICRPDRNTGTGCPQPGDSVFVLQPPPPPPDGFPTYYAIVYAANPRLLQGGFENKFVPDTLDAFARCTDPSDRRTCCNLNHLALNLMEDPIFLSGPPEEDLERVFVVPNPYRGNERWDPPGTNRIEFRNLPPRATIRIYTVAGDFLRELAHESDISGSASWDLENDNGDEVTAGIYIYRVTTPQGFRFTDHFVVIR